MSANVHYIRAAILDKTNQYLTLEDVVDLLLQEGMITHKQSQKMIMRDYSDYYDKDTSGYTDYVPKELVFEEV